MTSACCPSWYGLDVCLPFLMKRVRVKKKILRTNLLEIRKSHALNSVTISYLSGFQFSQALEFQILWTKIVKQAQTHLLHVQAT